MTDIDENWWKDLIGVAKKTTAFSLFTSKYSNWIHSIEKKGKDKMTNYKNHLCQKNVTHLSKNKFIAFIWIISTCWWYILDKVTYFLFVCTEVYPFCIISWFFILIVAMSKDSNANPRNFSEEASDCFFNPLSDLENPINKFWKLNYWQSK